ncbi:MAG: RidA family protein [Chitinophagales bacterium]
MSEGVKAKSAVGSAGAPAAVGPYSQAITVGDLVFCSGQIALAPATGDLVGESVAEQTAQVLKNLAAVLEAAGASLNDVVKTTVFLTDMARFGELNEVYARHFSAPFPARSTVEVRALPKGAAVEIEAVALLPAGR